MKLTNTQIKRIIREEIYGVISEMRNPELEKAMQYYSMPKMKKSSEPKMSSREEMAQELSDIVKEFLPTENPYDIEEYETQIENVLSSGGYMDITDIDSYPDADLYHFAMSLPNSQLETIELAKAGSDGFIKALDQE